MMLGCTREKSPLEPIPKEQDKKHIRGTVVLENQSNNGSCFVWLDSLWIGTVTDSSGYFDIPIPDSLHSTNGVFRLYYHIECFNWAARELELLQGQVVAGKHDVDKSGLVRGVFLEELARIKVTTDKAVYSAATDTIRYTIRVENLSEEEILFTSGGLAFYNLSSDTVTVYNPFYYPAGPPGIGISPGTIYAEDGFLWLPIDQRYPYWPYYRLPGGLMPPGDYFFTAVSSTARISDKGYSHMFYRENLFFFWSSYKYPPGFIMLLGWRPMFNVYDSKSIFFAKITIIP